ncbi:hypothetical protein ABS751_18960 [Bacillus subtilis]
MSSDKRRRDFTIDQETNDYILAYMDEHKLRYPGQAIMRICKEHHDSKQTQWSISYIVKTVAESIRNELGAELNKIKLGSNSADKNTQILIELLNGIYFDSEIADCIPTDIEEAQGVKTARDAVDRRIANQRQKKIDRAFSKTQGG